jgi:hypothetical protein
MEKKDLSTKRCVSEEIDGMIEKSCIKTTPLTTSTTVAKAAEQSQSRPVQP